MIQLRLTGKREKGGLKRTELERNVISQGCSAEIGEDPVTCKIQVVSY